MEQSNHQNVTRKASAPDTIKQWRGEVTGAVSQAEAATSHHSRSDSQLDKGQSQSPVNRTFSADPFSQPESWLSPLSLGVKYNYVALQSMVKIADGHGIMDDILKSQTDFRGFNLLHFATKNATIKSLE